MPLSDVFKIKISRPSLYSLFLASLGLAIVSIGLALLETVELIEAIPNVVDGLLVVIAITGAIIFASGVVYNGFFGSLSIGPIYETGKITKIAQEIFKKKVFFLIVIIALLVAGIFFSSVSLAGNMTIIIFLLTVFVFNFPFLVSYFQLIKNKYLPLRYIAEELDQLNKKTLYYSILKEIEEEEEFKNIVKMAQKEKNQPLLKKILFQELKNPYLARETVTVLLLNKIFSKDNPPKDFAKSTVFWQEKTYNQE